MHIAIPTQNYFQPNNGQAEFVRRLSDGLVARGHQVVVYTASERWRAYSVKRGEVEAATIPAVPLWPFYRDVYVTPWPQRAAFGLLDRFQPDVVHIQDHFPVCAAFARGAHHRGLPLVATNHFLPENIIPFVPVLARYARSRERMRRIMWRMVHRVFDTADAITTPTETAARVLRESGVGRPVQPISCGVDLSAYRRDLSTDRAAIRRRYGLSPDRTLFLFVGRLDREKRLDVLIRAMASVRGAGVQLAIAGRGRDEKHWKALADRSGMQDGVVFLGFVPQEDIVPLLTSSDVFAMPSEAELQSIATLQAMAAGLPVLAADARALPELVENGVNGYLFRAGDSGDAAARIRQLLAQRAGLREMGDASIRKVAAHSIANTVRQYEELYVEVAAARRARSEAQPATASA